MQTIVIRVRAMDLSAEMAAMRKWLDEHKCEPLNFTFRRFGNIISIYIVFDKDADGEAFKARFHGRPQGPEPDLVTQDLAQVLKPSPIEGEGCCKRGMLRQLRDTALARCNQPEVVGPILTADSRAQMPRKLQRPFRVARRAMARSLE